tara:strand:- start:2942 stop:3163 length:222 start_codon:yes stop_codon:yes gene_type:complete
MQHKFTAQSQKNNLLQYLARFSIKIFPEPPFLVRDSGHGKALTTTFSASWLQPKKGMEKKGLFVLEEPLSIGI